MLQHHRVNKSSTQKTIGRHWITQWGLFLPFWGVILIFILIMLACSLSPETSGTRTDRVVMLNRLPTLTPTPRNISQTDQQANASDAVAAGQFLPPSATTPPATGVPLDNAADLPTPLPTGATGDWEWVNTQLYPDQPEGLLLFSELTNNSGAPQLLTEITGTFYDAEGQEIATVENTIGYWPVDNIPPGGRIPVALIVEGISRAANFNLTVTAEPGSTIPRQEFEFLDVSQWNEADAYCLSGQLRNPGAGLQNYLIIGATLYSQQDNVVNFGDYFEPDVAAIGNDRPVDFEICIDPPHQETARYELWAWGE